jgi:hypothetical protein
MEIIDPISRLKSPSNLDLDLSKHGQQYPHNPEPGLQISHYYGSRKQIHVSRETIGIFVIIISRLLYSLGSLGMPVRLLSPKNQKLIAGNHFRRDLSKILNKLN